MKTAKLMTYALSLGLVGAPLAITIPATPTIAAEFSTQEQASIDVYQKASPAVVTIKAGSGSGSGSIISAEGLVLTNEHVVGSTRGREVTVTTSDGKRYRGIVISSDRQNDLALVQLQTQTRFPIIPLADRNGIQIGQQVYAIGSPFGLSGTFTTGTLSRIAPNGDLQTDAAINSGNSGGPLLNSRGELIGVNKAILSPGGQGNIGIGFATSAVTASQFIAQNRNRVDDGAAVARSNPTPDISRGDSDNSPRLGVAVDQTLVIQSVEAGSVASELGLKPGDRILAVNRRRVRHAEQLVNFLDSNPDRALLTIVRNRRLATVRVEF